MITISLECKTIEEAIALLAKIGDLAGAERVTVSTEQPKRKGRADKGQKREPYKPRETKPVEPAPEALATPEPVRVDPAVVPSYTPQDIQDRLKELLEKKGLDPALAMLGKFGAKSMSQLKSAQYQSFMEESAQVLAGE